MLEPPQPAAAVHTYHAYKQQHPWAGPTPLRHRLCWLGARGNMHINIAMTHTHVHTSRLCRLGARGNMHINIATCTRFHTHTHVHTSRLCRLGARGGRLAWPVAALLPLPPPALGTLGIFSL